MASDNDREDGGAREAGRRRKGKPTTIDLTATEVRARAEADRAATGGDTAPAAGDPDSLFVSTEAPARDPEPRVEAAPGSDPSTPEPTTETPASSPETPPKEQADAPPGTDPAADEPRGDAAASGITAGSEDGAAPGEPPSTAPSAAAAAPTGEATSDGTDDPRRRNGILSPLAAAAIGGLVVLAGGAGLMGAGLIGPSAPPPAASPESVAALDQRLADLQARLDAAPAAPDVAPLDRRLGELETALGALEGAPGDAALDELRAAVADLQARPVPETADGGAETAALAEDVANLRTALDETRAALDRLASAPPAVDPARVEALEGAFANLGDRLNDLDARLAAATDRLDGGLADLGTRLDEGLRTLRGEAETAASESTAATDALAGRVSAIEERIDRGPSGGEIAALSLAVASLSTKLDEGEPFAADLELVRPAAGDVDLSALDAVADTGAPTVAELRDDFPAAAIASGRPVDPSAGVLDRVLTGAKSLVNYRETGDDTTDDLSRPLAEAEAALADGDLPAAREALAGLPEWAEPKLADWRQRLDRRIAADAAVEAITGRLLARLREPAEGRP